MTWFKQQLDMKWIRHISAMALMLTFIACGNKSRQSEALIHVDQPAVERSEPDSTLSSAQDENKKVGEKSSVPVSPSASSSRSHKSSSYDNMRGFDPASEDDMEDNGMSRYMENNDEEGWD